VDPARRPIFNAAFNQALFDGFLERLQARVGPIPFQVAETPLMMTHGLRDWLARNAKEIVDQLSQPALLAKLKLAIPAHYNVPGMDFLPNCVQVDFAITKNDSGAMEGRVVELQAFPSLYALMPMMAEAWGETLNGIPGLEADWRWSIDEPASSLELLRQTIVGGEDPVEVALVDLTPELQKTAPDFEATRLMFGVEAVCVSELIKKGRALYRKRPNGQVVQVKRIYNRMVFDELEVKKAVIPFNWNEELDLTWCSHPNWYWTWSKFALPSLNHPAIPQARFLSDITELPADLTRYVLKPLFSFAGAGVVVDVTDEDIKKIPFEQRANWVLQEKITYAEAIKMPDGNGVKAEVRVMLARPPNGTDLIPVICLVRLSRGKMLGVDFNKGLTWVGGSVGIWPA
jgi:hypothetical protein